MTKSTIRYERISVADDFPCAWLRSCDTFSRAAWQGFAILATCHTNQLITLNNRTALHSAIFHIRRASHVKSLPTKIPLPKLLDERERALRSWWWISADDIARREKPHAAATCSSEEGNSASFAVSRDVVQVGTKGRLSLRLPSSSRRAVANSVVAEVSKPPTGDEASAVSRLPLEKTEKKNRLLVSLATELPKLSLARQMHLQLSSSSTVFFYPEKSRVVEGTETWFSTRKSRNPPCSVLLLLLSACSARIWKITVRRWTISNEFHNRVEIGEIHWIVDGKGCKLLLLIAAGKIQSKRHRSPQLPPRDIGGGHVGRCESRRKDPAFAFTIASFRHSICGARGSCSSVVFRPRITSLFSPSLNFHAHLGKPQHFPFHRTKYSSQ